MPVDGLAESTLPLLAFFVFVQAVMAVEAGDVDTRSAPRNRTFDWVLFDEEGPRGAARRCTPWLGRVGVVGTWVDHRGRRLKTPERYAFSPMTMDQAEMDKLLTNG